MVKGHVWQRTEMVFGLMHCAIVLRLRNNDFRISSVTGPVHEAGYCQLWTAACRLVREKRQFSGVT